MITSPPRLKRRRFAAAALGALMAPALARTGAAAVSPAADRAAVEALLRAYPDHLSGVDGDDLLWRDGTRMSLTAGTPDKSLAQMIRAGSILDMFRIPYPRGPYEGPPGDGEDPGRIRNRAFFEKMYGDCRHGGSQLVPVTWLPTSWGHALRATPVNGVARRLAAISEEIEALPPPIRRAAYPSAGTFNCRVVADTGMPSMHGTGTAIDLNVAMSDYWLWRRGAPYTNRMPMEIVAIFERHGFIWGGKWSHYDTMHFEYRPEMLGFDPARDA
jgi:hypothetical protein